MSDLLKYQNILCCMPGFEDCALLDLRYAAGELGVGNRERTVPPVPAMLLSVRNPGNEQLPDVRLRTPITAVHPAGLFRPSRMRTGTSSRSAGATGAHPGEPATIAGGPARTLPRQAPPRGSAAPDSAPAMLRQCLTAHHSRTPAAFPRISSSPPRPCGERTANPQQRIWECPSMTHRIRHRPIAVLNGSIQSENNH